MASSVLITGASKGIGAACASRLAQAGWTVFAGVRRQQDADKLVAATAGDIRPVRLDVSDEDQIGAAVAEIREVVGSTGLGGLVSNAGIGLPGPVEIVPVEDWRRQFEVNLFGAVALTRAVFELVRVADGRFVYIGSQAGRFSPAGMAPYAASKHALAALCESLWHEVAKTPMSVSLIEAGNVKTPIWDSATEQNDRVTAMLPDPRRADYASQMLALRGLAIDGAEHGITTERVVDKVEHALVAKRPKARYLVGPDARAIGGVVTRLPGPVRARIVAALTWRWARIGARASQGPRPARRDAQRGA